MKIRIRKILSYFKKILIGEGNNGENGYSIQMTSSQSANC